jgi:3-hydroxyisobutyrate dehydrogenase-like beta-hydroxyacid dehydrogenase
LGIVLNEAHKLGMALPATALAAQLMNALVGAGGGDRDSSALIEILEKLNGINP